MCVSCVAVRIRVPYTLVAEQSADHCCRAAKGISLGLPSNARRADLNTCLYAFKAIFTFIKTGDNPIEGNLK